MGTYFGTSSVFRYNVFCFLLESSQKMRPASLFVPLGGVSKSLVYPPWDPILAPAPQPRRSLFELQKPYCSLRKNKKNGFGLIAQIHFSLCQTSKLTAPTCWYRFEHLGPTKIIQKTKKTSKIIQQSKEINSCATSGTSFIK